MSNKSRWTREEELKLIKSISTGESLDILSIKHGRTSSAIELRLKKIIYENAIGGKSMENISKLLNIPEEKIRQYFYSYKEFNEKHGGLIDAIHMPPDNPTPLPIPVPMQFGGNNYMKNQMNNQMNNQIIGGRLNQGSFTENKFEKFEEKLKKLELENKILKLVVDNKDLTLKLNRLIKDGKVDKSIKGVIKSIRKSKEIL